jgi:Asp-tRNA(Asn)/Glu-tRNA(Gln) amidotransferase B subunit
MSRPNGWEVVIGLETHVQLSTRSKIFSGASTAFGAEPNRQACAVDMALPVGVRRRAMTALAAGCRCGAPLHEGRGSILWGSQ